ncbi:complex I subunit 5 family protein [Rhodospirillum rubrum]|uniref:NADH dehydrogenase (Quinone) n=1 Tax=Rhodospirillum rubrum (strain ATCC 11170 / ATH 1.1.1 / DSM 467 / LMG 4362 / NCIMB 8255 / S1) TaxID=269796 RepID=Q2RXM0_RHORT|nr:proton-conducting transporter membrane subunit [Rhodospirillum rubrum]ABC21125.1 NADH dehydrogenase (quinone) [Rhodospirillum rubrum ATCC 11170]AEO46793.1 NADH dehydrogenase (quinone) [Rhodospirillum rubrum F11]MBK5952672.1 oxidoreductase [Rhodospirillum rubrum]QXG80817.1 oxidoreductase [Rhodospirillum rubrum]HAQ00448.1 oxidoreductase [Rhodospirillum rubrum]
MANSSLLLLLFLIPALGAVVEYPLGRARSALAGAPSVAGALGAFAVAVTMAFRIAESGDLFALGGWFHADALSAVVAIVVTFVGLAATLFSIGYLRHEVEAGQYSQTRLPVYFVLNSVFIATMAAVTVTNNVIMMYVVVEATTLASALLVTYYRKPGAWEAGYKYLLLCSVGITMGLLGCVILYSAAVPLLGGHRAMQISELATVADQLPPTAVVVGCVLIIIGFGSKAGLIPFHAWLPDAHSQSPSPVSALLSGVTLKVAIYAIARIASLFYAGHGALGVFCIVLGAITMLGGIIAAFSQTDLKRLLAYSSVSQVGYIIMGLGIGSYLGFYGAVYHLMNHALDKAMLFLCTGLLLYSCGTTSIEELGKRKHSPLVALCFFIGALAISGVPPLNGFWSKFAIYTAAAEAHLWWALGVALLTSLITIAVLVRAGYLIFLRNTDHDHGSTDVSGDAALAFGDGAATPTFDGSAGTPAFDGSAVLAVGGRVPHQGYPVMMIGVVVTMTVLVVVTGLNLSVFNRLIDLSVGVLLR